MDYRAAIEFLYSFSDFERSGRFSSRRDLSPMLALLEALDNPHLGRMTVHVAGSKGKGSVAAMLESMLRAAGIVTGLNTSPHLCRITERVLVAGVEVSSAEFAEATARVAQAVEKVAPRLASGRRLVTFDLITALAFCIFKAHAVSVQIIEVGLGGLLDSTNVFERKECAVITRLGLEHRDILGNRLREIALNKAGILRPGCTAVMAPQLSEAAEVIRSEARRVGAPLVEVEPAAQSSLLSSSTQGQRCLLARQSGSLECELPLLGRHQIENATVAVAGLDALERAGVQVPDAAVQSGLKALTWPARIEVVSRAPWVVVDSAHTEDSALQLCSTLKEYLGIERATFVVGVMRDKELGLMAQAISRAARGVIATAVDHPRALEASAAAYTFRQAGVEALAEASLARALELALSAEGPAGAVVVMGSVALAGEARALLRALVSA
jgi:dihydrofolate synthase/folylpolyglutamate synthase